MTLLQRNVPGWERMARVLIGLGVMGYSLFAGWTGLWLAGALLAGAGMIGTALAGFCPAYAMAGRRLAQ